jgi:hypothetical protein
MREQILQIMTQFDSSSEASLNLMDTPSRVFIREAVMQKLCRRGPKEFKFWLFNDKLLYGEQKASGKYCLNRCVKCATISLHVRPLYFAVSDVGVSRCFLIPQRH